MATPVAAIRMEISRKFFNRVRFMMGSFRLKIRTTDFYDKFYKFFKYQGLLEISSE